MVFPYRQVSSEIRRPVIPVILKNRFPLPEGSGSLIFAQDSLHLRLKSRSFSAQNKSKFVLYSGLIDSGADYCIFNIQLAKELDIPLQPKKIILKGIGREKVTGYLGKVEISINGLNYDLTAIFAEMEEFGHGILGQKGFFDRFDVKLSYQKQTLEIKPATKES